MTIHIANYKCDCITVNTQNVAPEDATTYLCTEGYCPQSPQGCIEYPERCCHDVRGLCQHHLEVCQEDQNQLGPSYPNEIAPKQGYKTALAFNLNF